MSKVKFFLGILGIAFLLGLFSADDYVDGPDDVEHFYSQLVKFVSKDGSLNYVCLLNNTRYKYFIDKGELKVDEIEAENNELDKGISVADVTISDTIIDWDIRNIWKRIRKQPIKKSSLDVIKIFSGFELGKWVAIKLNDSPCNSVVVTKKLKQISTWKKMTRKSYGRFYFIKYGQSAFHKMEGVVRSTDFLEFEKIISNKE